MADSPNHYVIPVHGTWARQKSGEPVWYIPDKRQNNFCRRLGALLKGTYLEGAVWRKHEIVQWPFLWSGENTHKARLDGATELHSCINKIVETDKRAIIHFVAHSHGGNVVLAAIDRYLQRMDFQARSIYGSLRLLKFKLDRQQRRKEPVKPFRLSDTWSAPATDWDSGVKEILRANCGDRATEALQTHGSLIEEVRNQTEWGDEKTRKPVSNPWRQIMDEARPPANPKLESFVARWKGNSEWTRLGRIVFMGTPFLRKTWRSKPSTAFKVIAAFPFAVLGALYFPGILVVPVVLIYLLLAWPGWNPIEWHWLVQWGSIILMGGSVLAWLPRMTMGRWYDTNLYFRDYTPYNGMHKKEYVGHAIDPPLNALTIHAGPLDEALLALSTEPLIYGSLLPVIEHRVFAEPKQLRDVIGKTDSPVEWTWRGLNVALVSFRQLFHVATKRPLRPIRRQLTRMVASALSNILNASAFGLYPEEFERARVQASHTALVPDAIKEAVWDVSSHLTEAPTADTETYVAETRPERYKFLWNKTELERRAEASLLWRQVSNRMESICERYPDDPTIKLRSQLMKTCVMIEEKQREIAGAIELKHSTYYSNEQVIRGIAEFLTKGEKPKD